MKDILQHLATVLHVYHDGGDEVREMKLKSKEYFTTCPINSMNPQKCVLVQHRKELYKAEN